MTAMTDVPLSDLYDSPWPECEVGELRPGARKLLQDLRHDGKQIRITSPLLASPVGTRFVLNRLYADDLPFDELEQ